MERFILFKLDFVQVVDSYQFLSESLEKLVENLKNSNYDFPITNKLFANKINNSNTKRDLLYKKAKYPYEYMDNFDKFYETKLPKIEDFYSELNQSKITEEQYGHSKKIWQEFNIESLGD